MSILIKEKELPLDLTLEQAVTAAYCEEITDIVSKVQRGLPTLIECDKKLVPYLYLEIRNRLRTHDLRCRYLDGREQVQAGMMPQGIMGTIISQLRESVRGSVEQTVIVMPHLDLLTTSVGGLTNEAREVIPLLYENPSLVWIGFKDPSFPLPEVIENLFSYKINLIGIKRNKVKSLVLQRESRKFGHDFNPYALYKYISGMNAISLRKVLSNLVGEDYPADNSKAYAQLRQSTAGTLEMPNVDLDKDIGGYAKVKAQLQEEILDILKYKDNIDNAENIKRLEDLIPRGILFHGPPGVGKTVIAKAVATALGATISIVSGPELKSKWVGQSEENLRQIFYKARQSAPSVIVFDEIDSFATARGTYEGSGVEHSMVNQLLTEMDGFHKEEMVFIIGTTNFVESLDPALLRPGRFEFHLHIPYPDMDARKHIFEIYNKKMKLLLSEENIEYLVKRTGKGYLTCTGTPFSGDHINSICRLIARMRIRKEIYTDLTNQDIENAITERVEKPKLTKREKNILATHESGHAVVSLFCPYAPSIEKITIESENPWSFGYVMHKDSNHKYILSRNYLLDNICVALGAREAERLLLDDLSLGATQDVEVATMMARELVEIQGMGVVSRKYSDNEFKRYSSLSSEKLVEVDRAVDDILTFQQQRASSIVKENRQILETLRDLLLEKKTIDSKTLTEFIKCDLPEKIAVETE